MAEPQDSAPDISIEPTFGFKIVETRPDEILRHNISDEELGRLADMGRDRFWMYEIMWVTVGAFIGVAPACISALYYSYLAVNTTPLSAVSLIQVIVFFVCLFAFLILVVVTRDKWKTTTDLAAAIRERTKHTVHGAR